MKRQLTAAAVALTTLLITTTPAATARPVDTTEISAKKLNSLLLSANEVSRIYDVPVNDTGSADKPEQPWSLDKRECGVLMSLTTQTFGSSQDAFLTTHMTVSDDNGQPVVLIMQAGAVYSDAEAAEQTFEDAYPSSLQRRCDRAVVHSRKDPPEISYGIQVVQVTRDHAQSLVHWLQNDEPIGISCAVNVQPAGNALFGVIICAPGDATRLTEDFMTRITNRAAGM